MAEASEELHIQASFYTEIERISVQNTPFSLPFSATREDLTQLINQLLTGDEDEHGTKLDFDFLINGTLLNKTLGQLIESLQILTETVVQIEYIERSPPPSLDNEFPHNDWVSAVHCNDKYILTGSYDNIIQISTHDGELITKCHGHEQAVTSVAWLPESCDSHMFVSSSHDQHAHIWKFDGATGEIKLLYVCKGHSRIIEGIAVSPDGKKFCSGGWDKHLKIWSSMIDNSDLKEESDGEPKRRKLMDDAKPNSRVPIATFAGHTHPIMSVKWVEEGEILSAGYDHCIRVWDIQSGVSINTLNGSKVFLDIDKSHGGHVIASGHTDKHIRIWDTRVSSTSLVTCTLSSHHGWVRRVRWSPCNEHQLVSGSYDNTAKLWDTRRCYAFVYYTYIYDILVRWGCRSSGIFPQFCFLLI